jgi:iron(III) transport system ATP-binding protein
MTTAPAAIAFERVTKRYGEIAAIDDVSFVIDRGALVTLLGPSGCGKTTTLRLIAGLELPSAGTIRIRGEDVSRVPASERDVSMVFQSYALFPHMSVLENVGYGLRVRGLSDADADAGARETLALVGLQGLDQRLPSELSGGQQQRVAVARALVLEPAVLLFDEPLSNLDSRLRRQMRDEIRELQQRLALTVVYVTHDQAEAMAVSDRIIVMNRAVIAQQGAPRELYEQPRDGFVASFMGEANRVPGRLRRLDGELAEVSIGALTLRLPHRGLRDGDVELAIRPESIRLDALGRPASAASHAEATVTGAPGDALAGTVRKAAYLGSWVEYTVVTEVGELFAIDLGSAMPFASGEPVSVRFVRHGVVPLARRA